MDAKQKLKRRKAMRKKIMARHKIRKYSSFTAFEKLGVSLDEFKGDVAKEHLDLEGDDKDFALDEDLKNIKYTFKIQAGHAFGLQTLSILDKVACENQVLPGLVLDSLSKVCLAVHEPSKLPLWLPTLQRCAVRAMFEESTAVFVEKHGFAATKGGMVSHEYKLDDITMQFIRIQQDASGRNINEAEAELMLDIELSRQPTLDVHMFYVLGVCKKRELQLAPVVALYKLELGLR